MATNSKKSKKNQQSVGAILLIALLSLLLVGIIVTASVLGVKSDGFKDWGFIGKPSEQPQPKLDVVLAEGETLIDVYNNTTTSIKVVNGGNFTVKVQPKADAFFDFRLDGKLCAFSATSGDYNRVFNVTIDGDVVSFSSLQKTILDVLNIAYFGHVISDVPSFDTYEKVFFECVITAESGQSATIDIFGIGTATVIDLNPGKVVF